MNFIVFYFAKTLSQESAVFSKSVNNYTLISILTLLCIYAIAAFSINMH